MTLSRPFAQVDVFGSDHGVGNPVAVVLDAEGLSDAHMADFARWTNLSETTFVLPPSGSADYRVRIFTPEGELPFAGHPTLGTCHAWRDHVGAPSGRFVQECEAGLVPVMSTDLGLAFAAPPTITSGPLSDVLLEQVCDDLGVAPATVVSHQWVDNGPGWVAVELSSAAEVLALEVPVALNGPCVGVFGGHNSGDAAYEVRAFFGEKVVVEDPVTGSLHASIAQWLRREGRAGESYVAAQGTAMGRAGRVSITDDGEEIWVGGRTETIVTGTTTAAVRR